MKVRKPMIFVASMLAAIVTTAEARTVLQNKGSDTLVNVAQAWAEEYQKKTDKVAIAVRGGGSGPGIAAMINGTVDIANASRKLKETDKKMAKERGQNPVEHVVGYDALAVFVHKDNPANQFTIEQLADVFGRKGNAKNWSDLGLKVPGC